MLFAAPGAPADGDANHGHSAPSFMEDVEMAHDEVELQPMRARRTTRHQLTTSIKMFAGPMSESVPTSISSFAHRRARADSTTSFAYYDETLDEDADVEEDAIAEEYGEIEYDGYTVEELDELENGGSPTPSRRRRKSSGFSGRSSVDRPLLNRQSSGSSTGSADGTRGRRTNQKIYILTEDLTIVVAGFDTSRIGFAIYLAICTVTVGLAWLVFQWIPKWKVALVGRAAPLKECAWLVIENQWGEFAVQQIDEQEYGRSLSSVFGVPEKDRHRDYDEDFDPVIRQLRCLDYRYIRFCYNPLKDKFVLANTWQDPAWTNVTALREGLDTEERDYRELVFGKNMIDLAEKPLGQLLVEEVINPFYVFQIASLFLWSVDEYYYYAACIFVISVVSIAATVVETRATMKRLRDVSRFECEVRVIRNGFWRTVDSAELVPGDVYEVTDPSLTQLPCDSLLLSGDCIVNESMLTGESVPVSKIPMSDEVRYSQYDMLRVGYCYIQPRVAQQTETFRRTLMTWALLLTYSCVSRLSRFLT
jgi:cation-transporting ATPase 13A2